MESFNTDQQNSLLKLADSQLLPNLFNIVDINYSVLDVNGNYLIQNNRTINNISHGLLKAKDIDAATWDDCEKTIQSKKKSIKEEFFKDRYYLSIKQPLMENNNCLGIMVLSIDITERKKAEIAKAEFIRNMSHDIRTPVAGLLGVARLLQDDETDPSKHFYLDALVSSSERLFALLNQVLDASNMDIASQPVSNTPVDVRAIISEVCELMEATVRLKGLTISYKCKDVTFDTDKVKLTRMLVNLVGNAVKFTEQGQVNIEVVTEPKLRICVQDTGIGIPADKIDYIFDKFTKLKQSGESQTFTGSGIGLYMTKQLANDLGGDIIVESEVGKGSTFSFVVN